MADADVRELRERTVRNLLVTLAVAQGVPMLLAGDEMGRTQRGNNNAYCQDNETSWLDWSGRDAHGKLGSYVRDLIALRRAQPVLRRGSFFQGRRLGEGIYKDLVWLRPDGQEIDEQDWAKATLRAFGMRLDGESIPDVGPRGEPIRGDTLLVLFNADETSVDFVLPAALRERWRLVLDTTRADIAAHGQDFGVFDRHYRVAARAAAVLVAATGGVP
jgi:glycogen operon protein